METLHPLRLRGEVTRALVGSEPAAIFLGHRQPNTPELIAEAALFAYHASVEWGVVTNFMETVVFNSRWVRDQAWFTLPSVAWGDLRDGGAPLQQLTPDGLTNGTIDKAAFSLVEPDRELVPVDDALVDCLDSWRAEALRHSGRTQGLDTDLQNLFAQLFVLRAVEDRGVAGELKPLRSVLECADEVLHAELQRLFRSARGEIQSDLFDAAVSQDIPAFVVRGIVEDLYVPRDLPVPGAHYDFAWVDADVLGRAYEKYLSTVLVPYRPQRQQLRLWHQPKREVERTSRRRAGGVYYTPQFIVRYLVHKSLDLFYEQEKSGSRAPRVLDPACGSGSFLVAVADGLIRRLRETDPDRNWGRELVERRCIFGVDVDERAVTLARLSMWLRLAQEPDPLPLPSLKKTIVCANSLQRAAWVELPKTYDIVVGNPPFLAAARVPGKSELSSQFQTAKGRFDISYLFVELALGKLKNGGVLAFVIPNRLFTNRDAGTLRRLLTDEANVLVAADFGETELFRAATCYVALLVARREREPADSMHFIEVRELPGRFPGSILPPTYQGTRELHTRYVVAFDLRHPRGDSPWLLLSQADRRRRVQLEEASEPLSAVADVVQGIKTGANDVFVVQPLGAQGGPLCQIVNGLGDEHLVERACLRPVVFGAEITRYALVRAARCVIYPYEKGTVLPEDTFAARYPYAYQYMLCYRELLDARRSIVSQRQGWYEMVRERDVSWLEAPKLVMRDLATRPAFALDSPGGTYLIGGTAIVPADPSLAEALLAYVNSRAAAWYLRLMAPGFRGGFQKFEPQHIRQLPVPAGLIGDPDVQQRLSVLVERVLAAAAADDVSSRRTFEAAIDRELEAALGFALDEVL